MADVYVPAAGEYVTVGNMVLQSGLVDRSYTSDLWHVVAANDLTVYLRAIRPHPLFDTILVTIGERPFSPAPVAMVRAMCGDEAAMELEELRSRRDNLDEQLREVLDSTKEQTR